MEKKKKIEKKIQFNGPEQFLWHFIVASGTWTTNLPVYMQTASFVGWTYLPYAAGRVH